MRAITVSRYRDQCAYAESVPDYGLERSGARGALKVEDTWCGMLCECSSRIRYSSEKLFRGAVARTASHTNRNSNGNLYVRCLYWDDGRWNWSNNWLDNDFNGINPALLRATLFTSHPANCGVEFL